MPFTIKSNIIKSIDKKIKYKQPNENGKKHFHLGVWLDATDRELDEVSFVEYKLHPSFKNQIRKSSNRPNNFSVTFWTWGMFNIEVTIHFHSGSKETITYYLEYNLPADLTEYVKI